MRFLTGETIPQYKFSSFRFFEKDEKHVDRICNEDVLLLVFSGTLRFSENGILIEVGEGEYYIQEKGIHQAGVVPSDEPKYYYVHFAGEFSDEERGYLKVKGIFDRNRVEALIKKLETARISNAPAIERHNTFLSILSELSLENTKKDSRFSFDIYNFINRNLKENLTLERLSHEFGYCKNYIIKLFKKEFDLAPHEYITLRRIDVAKNLLISSDMSSAEIADECGFGTYINFYKSFRKNEGCSPNEFRRRMRS